LFFFLLFLLVQKKRKKKGNKNKNISDGRLPRIYLRPATGRIMFDLWKRAEWYILDSEPAVTFISFCIFS